ncbi:biotin-dependent carboxyltransferase family protein [uncultured Eudoraea sp.]|uniref:5-oxoprolinase subunit C family protein n=1 Tax=uncultured Eudoraea sp. TaxID=1035614 RepID=UPI0026386271|nr:biotin-dependent carboxyltransferase family protein [uncultured Eudoraea sp.]
MIKVIHPGFFTTIQDMGRFGYRDKGVPVCGCMDNYSASMANSLLENAEMDAVMEITMTGPKLEFHTASFFSITGAEMSPALNSVPINSYEVHKANEGDILSFGKLINGFRSYLAVKGGFLTETKLMSRSYYMPITDQNCIAERMEIPIEEYSDYSPKISHIIPESSHKEFELKVFKGPEYKILTDNQLKLLFANKFTIAKENNRMAYQLEELIGVQSHKMLTSATLPGTVQLTPAGKLIILMRDGQTTGGYPRILQLATKSIAMLSQRKFGDEVSFHLLPH